MTTDTSVRNIATLPSLGVPRHLSLFTLCASLAFMSACGDNTPPGTNPDTDTIEDADIDYPNDTGALYGEECKVNSDCRTNFCTTFSPNSDDAFCGFPCAEDSDCPQGVASSCIFVQRNDRLAQVCAPKDLCIDRDEDGFGTGPGCLGSDCDDTNASIHPGAAELCDGLDNNCDGLIDINTEDSGTACETGQLGVCKVGIRVCEGGSLSCSTTIQPGTRTEICDGLDNDCDGLIDEGPVFPGEPGYGEQDANYIVGLGQSCGDANSEGCFTGILRCDSENRVLECEGNYEPKDIPDLCNYIDDNCDGRIDEDYLALFPTYGDPCSVGEGTCRSVGSLACDPNNAAAPPICSAVPNTGNSEPETCNYFDDDCDGHVDNGFVNSNGVYDTLEACGNCAVNCANQWQPSAAANNVVPKCVATTTTASCAFDCLPGFVDFDRIRSNGCELKPDLNAVYVASQERGGNDSGTCGTYDAPCASISHALTRATASRNRILVGEGTFTGGFTMEGHIQVLGGHSSATWERNPAINMSALRGGSTDGLNTFSVRIRNVTATNGAAELSGFTIEAPDANVLSGNSIGIWVVNANNTLTIRDNTVLAGRGGAGSPGSAGTNGAQGAAGKAGKDRVNDSSSCNETNGIALAGGEGGTNTCGGTNVSGGAGAATNCPGSGFTEINSDRGRAQTGRYGADTGGAAGASPNHYRPIAETHGVFGCQVDENQVTESPTPGHNGFVGSDGTFGAGATNARGSITSNAWVGQGGGSGTAGANGAGGGGGGSSGGILANIGNQPVVSHYGATGGGGGAGGCAATGGTGGSAGGASFGLFLSGSGALPVIESNVFHRGNGGRGGQGGIGGVGGDGGTGGAGGKQVISTRWSRCGQNAAGGGGGGRGGHGGGGGGGAGGIAFDVAISGYTGSTIPSSNKHTIPNTTKTGGLAGQGGAGIVSSGSPGVAGESGSVVKF